MFHFQCLMHQAHRNRRWHRIERPDQFLPIILMFVVLYFLMIRPQMKRQKEHEIDDGCAGQGRRSHHRRRHARPGDQGHRRLCDRRSRGRHRSRGAKGRRHRRCCRRAPSSRCKASSFASGAACRYAVHVDSFASRHAPRPQNFPSHESLSPLEIHPDRRGAAARPAVHGAELFGESPAVQISSAKATVKVDQSTPMGRGARRAASKTASQPDGVSFEGVGTPALGARALRDYRHPVQGQGRARKRAEPRPGRPDYIVAFNLVHEHAALAAEPACAADVPRPGPARRRALPAAGRHQGGA